jgi:hypothetical protein
MWPRPLACHRPPEWTIHTNAIEGFWPIVKRGIVGAFRKVTPKYRPLCVAEFQFRYNNRRNDGVFGTTING